MGGGLKHRSALSLEQRLHSMERCEKCTSYSSLEL